MKALKEKIIHCFNQGAKTYEQAADVQVIAAHRLRDQLQAVSAQKILEIGCGTGLFSALMVEQFPNADLTVTDVSPFMLKTAGDRFKGNPHVRTAYLDGENVPLSLAHDLIVSSMALHWFTQFDVSMKKIIEAMQPNKQFSFALLGAHSLFEWQALCVANRLPVGKLDFPSAAALQSICPAAEIQVERVTQSYPSLHAFLKTLKQLGAHATEDHYQKLSVTALRQLIRHTEKPFQLSYEIIYGTYIKS